MGLRGAIIGSLNREVLTANLSTPLGLPYQAGNQSEVRVSFQRPTSAARLSVNVMADTATSATGTEFFIDYDTLRLLPEDKTIDLTLYVDNTFTEAFWMGGRVAMTIVTKSSGGIDDVLVRASEAGVT